MDLRLSLLDSFTTTGSDGGTWKVCVFDRLAPDVSLADGREHWESTGKIEYRLADGRLIDVQSDGTARVVRSDLVLTLPPGESS